MKISPEVSGCVTADTVTSLYQLEALPVPIIHYDVLNMMNYPICTRGVISLKDYLVHIVGWDEVEADRFIALSGMSCQPIS